MKNDYIYESSNGIDEWLNDAMTGKLTGGLTTLTDAARNVMYSQTRQMVGTIVDYKELMMMYTCAMKEIQTKFDVLNTEFNVRYQRNPISSISTQCAGMLASKGFPGGIQCVGGKRLKKGQLLHSANLSGASEKEWLSVRDVTIVLEKESR